MWGFMLVLALGLFWAYRVGGWPAMWAGLTLTIVAFVFGAWMHSRYMGAVLSKSGMVKIGDGSDARIIRSTSSGAKR